MYQARYTGRMYARRLASARDSRGAVTCATIPIPPVNMTRTQTHAPRGCVTGAAGPSELFNSSTPPSGRPEGPNRTRR